MKKSTFAAILIAVATFGSSAQANDLEAMIAERQANKAHIAEEIAQLEASYPSFCAEAAKKDDADLVACIAGYKMLVASAQKDAAVVEFQLAAAQTNAKSRGELLKIAPPKEFNDEGAITKRRSNELGQFFLKLKTKTASTTGKKN